MIRAAILDNNAIARGLLRTILNDGYNVISESGVASANLSRLTLAAPQLIFIAIDTENHDVQTMLKDLRNRLPKALIFVMTSAFTAEMIKQASENGVNGFIVKPFNGAAVMSAIRASILKLVSRQRAEMKV